MRIDTTNVLNHPQPGGIEFDMQDEAFGTMTTKTGGRAFQGTVRFSF